MVVGHLQKDLEAEVADQVTVTFRCIPEKLPKNVEHCVFHLTDGDTTVAVEVSGGWNTEGLAPGTFVPRDNVVSMLAEHCCEKKAVTAGGFIRIGDYGKYGSGMKVSPSTAAFAPEEEKPTLLYRFRIDQGGDYSVQVYTSPNNPVELGTPVRLMAHSGEQTRIVELIPSDFRAGENDDPRWCQGVLDMIHVAETEFRFERGIHTLSVSPLEPGTVLEKIVIYPKGTSLPQSYFGPQESWFTP